MLNYIVSYEVDTEDAIAIAVQGSDTTVMS